jgi:large subunit ribosomal protein L10Ae
LPNIPRPGQKICLIGDAAHIDIAEGNNIPSMSADDLKKLNKDKVREKSKSSRIKYHGKVFNVDV